jgi:hypothetical protein
VEGVENSEALGSFVGLEVYIRVVESVEVADFVVGKAAVFSFEVIGMGQVLDCDCVVHDLVKVASELHPSSSVVVVVVVVGVAFVAFVVAFPPFFDSFLRPVVATLFFPVHGLVSSDHQFLLYASSVLFPRYLPFFLPIPDVLVDTFHVHFCHLSLVPGRL